MPRFLRRCIYRYVPCNISNKHLLSDEIKLRLVIQIDRFYRREGRRVKSAIKATRVSINTRARFVPDETDVWNRSPLLPAAVDRLHLRRLRRWLQGEYRSLCVARTSFNIIIATSTFDGTRNRLPLPGERIKRRGNRFTLARPPFDCHENAQYSTEQIYGSASCTLRNSFPFSRHHPFVAVFVLGLERRRYRRWSER